MADRLTRIVAAAAVLAIAACVLPTASAADPPIVLRHDLGMTVLAPSCGPVLTEPFDIPEDAVVTAANFSVSPDLVTTPLLSALVEVRAGATLVASNLLTTSPILLGVAGSLDISGLNAHLLNQSSSNGSLRLDLEVSVCPTTGAASVRLDYASVTYVRTSINTSANGSAPAAIVGISIGGSNSTAVEAGVPLALAPIVNGSLGAGFQFSWFVDGVLAGHGENLGNITLTPGEHNITLRASNGTSVQTASVHVSAAARLPPPNGPFNVVAIAAISALAIAGIAVGGTESGRWRVVSPVAGSVFARLKKASLLDHFVRGTLYQVIRENPGVHFAELRRRAQIGNGAASHHLRMLEKGGYVKVVVDGTKTKFYTTDRPLQDEVYGVSDTERAILSAVTESPGIGQADLATKLNRSPSVISRSVQRLVTLGFVITSHEGARVLVFPRQGSEALDPLAPPWPDEGA